MSGYGSMSPGRGAEGAGMGIGGREADAAEAGSAPWLERTRRPVGPAGHDPSPDALNRAPWRLRLVGGWRARRAIRAAARPRRLRDFLPGVDGWMETPPHPLPRRLAFTILLLAVCALAWSILGHVDIVATAPGQLIVSERSKLIQPLEPAVVRRVLVGEGQRVRAGDLLVELDATTAQADERSIRNERQAAQSEALRARLLGGMLDAIGPARAAGALAAPIAGAAPSADGAASLPALVPPADWSPAQLASTRAELTAEAGDIRARLARAGAEIEQRRAEQRTAAEVLAKLETLLPLARRRESDIGTLAAQGFMSSHAEQDRRRERLELERDLATQQARAREAAAALQASERARAAWLAETRRALRERQSAGERKDEQAGEALQKAMQRRRLLSLRAPVDGSVQQIAVHTEGGVVTEAQVLMVVVPEDARLSAEVTLENKDIGFVAPGQRARVKLETFPFTRYGTVGATVRTVSADAVHDEKRGAIYAVRLELDRPDIVVDGRVVRLAPGMNLSAEILTGERRIVEFLTSPVERALSESLRER